MAGGGTGGHVMPLLAVARELRARGHEAVFIGTPGGMEARLAPLEKFLFERIEIGGLNRVSPRRKLSTLLQLPWSVWKSARLLRKHRPAAVFSLGGYVAGPVMLASLWARLPVIVMEPNVVPGAAIRWFRHFVAKALVSFPETAARFPPGRAEVAGLPVREEFFALPEKKDPAFFRVLITGGSQGSRTLNRAARESWPLLAARGPGIRMTLQTGAAGYADAADAFRESGMEGEVVEFIADMPAAFACADLVVSRAGAGAVAELAAAGKPSLLIPFPFAADDHQLKNAEAFEARGAARLVRDADLTGVRLAAEILALKADPELLARMAAAARTFAMPGAARRAADLLEELSGRAGN
ncbi:MAG: undecaprenyldiphospho-muramoylpentapeptide beta-N-acetylglucosaminyltransferase [Bryobacteraceae bacterium]|nr:undecaprenyldiphospho-muramoylpentapeptide beta-N-acetylglucosaminyltransferase [Bryobacteraceae bacterium]